MATPSGSTSKLPTYSASGQTISPGWMWILSIAGLAIAWGVWPQAHPFIVVIGLVIAFILWVTESGRIESQIGSVVSGKA